MSGWNPHPENDIVSTDLATRPTPLTGPCSTCGFPHMCAVPPGPADPDDRWLRSCPCCRTVVSVPHNWRERLARWDAMSKPFAVVPTPPPGPWWWGIYVWAQVSRVRVRRMFGLSPTKREATP